MKTTLLVATSEDGFITDRYGNGDFSSPEDKIQFRAFLHSDAVDCFVCGRKTAEEFQERLTYKPLFVLTHKPLKPEENRIYITNLNELYQEMKKRELSRCTLLGGAQTYEYFLENNVVDEIRLTKENMVFEEGVHLDIEKQLPKFSQKEIKPLSKNTTLFIFEKKGRE